MIEKINKKLAGLTDFEKKYGYMFLEADEETADPTKIEAVVTSRTKQINATDEPSGEDITIDDTPDEDLDLEDEGMNDDTNPDTDTGTEENTGEETNPDTETPEETGDENIDNDDDTPDDGEIATDDDVIDDGEEPTDNENPDDGEITTDDTVDDTNDGENDTPDDGGDGGEEIATDDTETTDDVAAENTDNGGDNTTENNTDDNEGIKKQNLFKKFVNLHESLDVYISKLDVTVGIDDVMNKQINIINDNLKQIREVLYDYMILKFKANTYLQNMLFYQRSITGINLLLDDLGNVWVDKEAKKDEKSKDVGQTNK